MFSLLPDQPKLWQYRVFEHQEKCDEKLVLYLLSVTDVCNDMGMYTGVMNGWIVSEWSSGRSDAVDQLPAECRETHGGGDEGKKPATDLHRVGKELYEWAQITTNSRASHPSWHKHSTT